MRSLVKDASPVVSEAVRSADRGRILIVAPEPFYQERGTPIALRRVVEAAAREGYAVDLLTYPVGDSILVPGLRIIRVGKFLPILNVPIGMSFRKLLLDLILFFGIIKWTSRERYRFIHAVEEATFLAILLRPWHKRPVLYDMQSSLPEQLAAYRGFRLGPVQRILKRCEGWLIHRADEIVCSAGLSNHVRDIRPHLPVRVWSFPGLTGSPDFQSVSDLRTELGLDPGTRIIVYAGNFEPYQGIVRLLDSVPYVTSKAPNVCFILVGGDVSNATRLTEHPSWARSQKHLLWMPRQSQKDIVRYFALADVLVSPRDYGQNIGIKVFDYLAAGKPIVATDTPAHRSVLDDNRALLVGLEPEAIGRGILGLLEDPAEAGRLGREAGLFAEEQLGWNVFQKGLGKLYRSVERRGEKRAEGPEVLTDDRE